MSQISAGSRWMKRSAVVLAAVLAVGVSGKRAFADDYFARSDAQSLIERDKAELDVARARVVEIASARDRQIRELKSLRQQSNVPSATARTGNADLDKAMADRAALQAQTKVIQQKYDAAKADADRVHGEALAKFESTEEFKAAFAKFDQARKDLKGPTDAALDQLAQSREFQDAVAAARSAKATEQKLMDDKSADQSAIRAAHENFVAADTKVRDLEEKAVLADAKVTAIRQQVDAAQEPLRQMRDKFEQDLEKERSFAAILDDMQQQQSALDAALADQKKIDVQIASLQGGGSGGFDSAVTSSTHVSDSASDAIRNGERKLDEITADLQRAQSDAAKLEGRLRDDQDSVGYARRDLDTVDRSMSDRAPYPPENERVREERIIERETVIEQPTYVESTVVEVPYYSPVYVVPRYDYPCYDGYYSSFSLSFGFHDDYCDRGFWNYGHRDYGYGRWGRDYNYRGWGGSRYSAWYGNRRGGDDRRDNGRNWHDSSRRAQLASEYQIRKDRRSEQFTSERSAYASRVDRRSQYATDQLRSQQAAYSDRVQRRADVALADRSSYEQRVQRRVDTAQSDRGAYQERVQRRAETASASSAAPATVRRDYGQQQRASADRQSYQERSSRRSSEAPSSPRQAEQGARVHRNNDSAPPASSTPRYRSSPAPSAPARSEAPARERSSPPRAAAPSRERSSPPPAASRSPSRDQPSGSAARTGGSNATSSRRSR